MSNAPCPPPQQPYPSPPQSHPPYPAPQQPYPPPPQKRSRSPIWIILIAVVGAFLLFVVLVTAGIAIYAWPKYMRETKKIEAQTTIEQLAKDAAAAYKRDGKLCPSASSPVPATVPRGTKYQSSSGDWEADKAADAGFACLRFKMATPQYYQYDYRSTPDGFTVIARGDLNGNGVTSRFWLEGRLRGGVVSIAPHLKEKNPDE